MPLSKIYYAKPSISELEIRYVSDAAAHGWGERCYDYLLRFEHAFQEYIGTKYVLATSSATGALHLGMAALGIGPGDEVILADTNWIASVAPVVHLGAKPVFVDILSDTWCLDPIHVETAITPRTKAILAVHLYGNLCKMDVLERLAAKHGLFLIEDAAEAIGSGWGGLPAGARGIFGVFSFHGTKTMTTGEGGMLVTNDPELYEKALTLNNHGRKRGETRQFWASIVGYKFRMSNIQAALGCAQLERINELVERRRAIFFKYRDSLSSLPVTLNPIPVPNERYGYWMPSIIFSKQCEVTSENALQAMAEHNIEARSFFSPLSKQAHFTCCSENRVSRNIASRAVNLPSYHDLSDAEQERVVDVVMKLCKNKF